MIRLALATGFLAVFGVVAYAIVILLVKQFNKPPKNPTDGTDQPNVKEI